MPSQLHSQFWSNIGVCQCRYKRVSQRVEAALRDHSLATATARGESVPDFLLGLDGTGIDCHTPLVKSKGFCGLGQRMVLFAIRVNPVRI